MIATNNDRANTERRNILTSTATTALLVGSLSAVALSLAFPKVGIEWLARFALVGLFWSWFATPARLAARNGFITGVVYFSLMFAWFYETAGPLLGVAGFVTVLGPALIEAVPFALGAFLASLAFARAPRAVAPLAAAAAFTLCEWLRSVGFMGAPFAQVGYSQVDTSVAALAAYGGSYLVTFALCAAAASIAALVIDPSRERRIPSVVAILGVALAAALAYSFWPARNLAPATIPVAAIQGNIKQTVKMTGDGPRLAIATYPMLTRRVRAFHPELVLWPETVINLIIGDEAFLPPTQVDPALGLRESFGALARELNTTLIVGSLQQNATGLHNALYVFEPTGALQQVYEKRQLVPFAEVLPARNILGKLPYTDLVGRQTPGTDDSVITAGTLRAAPLICWESAFGDLVRPQLQRGANVLVVPTDDAWFGATAGPYQHAQISQMRAIESGRYVVRAAATGVSGIIAPNGRWTARAEVGEQAVVTGYVGAPVDTLFARIGAMPIVGTLFLFYVASVGIGSARRRAR